MSNLVVLSDLHANARALEAAIIQEGWGAEYVVLGDIHGLNGFPKETQELVTSLNRVATLAGNHDKAIFDHGEGHVNSTELSEYELNHTLSNLSDDEIEWMKDLPYMDIVERDGQRCCFAHAWPYPEKASGYEMGNGGVSKRAIPMVASSVADDYDWVFLGHTHEQYELDCSKFGHNVHFVNPGSLGYNGEYATVDTSTGTVSLETIEWDENAVKERVQNTLTDDAPHVNDWL